MHLRCFDLNSMGGMCVRRISPVPFLYELERKLLVFLLCEVSFHLDWHFTDRMTTIARIVGRVPVTSTYQSSLTHPTGSNIAGSRSGVYAFQPTASRPSHHVELERSALGRR